MTPLSERIAQETVRSHEIIEKRLEWSREVAALETRAAAPAAPLEDGRDRAIRNLTEQVVDLKRELAAVQRPLPAQMDELRARIVEVRNTVVAALDGLLKAVPVPFDGEASAQAEDERAGVAQEAAR